MSVLSSALATTVLVTYRDVKAGTNLLNPIPHVPLPSQYASVILVYGALSLLPDSASTLASILGWGFTLAVALNMFDAGGNVRTTNASNAPTVAPAS